jgi:hypothetical protein
MGMSPHRRYWQCDPQRSRVTLPSVKVELIDFSARPGPPYSPEQATLISEAAASDTMLTVAAARAHLRGGTSLFLGTATPQVTVDMLIEASGLLDRFDAVIGPTTADGWWALGLRDPRLAGRLRIFGDAGSVALAALRYDLQVAMLPPLRAVDSADDARAVAQLCRPGSRFAATMAGLAGVQAP